MRAEGRPDFAKVDVECTGPFGDPVGLAVGSGVTNVAFCKQDCHLVYGEVAEVAVFTVDYIHPSVK